MDKAAILDVLRDARRELEELETQLDWYTAGRLLDKLDQIIAEIESGT